MLFLKCQQIPRLWAPSVIFFMQAFTSDLIHWINSIISSSLLIPWSTSPIESSLLISRPNFLSVTYCTKLEISVLNSPPNFNPYWTKWISISLTIPSKLSMWYHKCPCCWLVKFRRTALKNYPKLSMLKITEIYVHGSGG